MKESLRVALNQHKNYDIKLVMYDKHDAGGFDRFKIVDVYADIVRKTIMIEIERVQEN